MDYYFDSFPDEITKWDVIRDIIDLYLDDERNDNGTCSSGVQLLPRQDVMVYGIIPKMEQILYIQCKECKLVFNPRDILLHKTCPEKLHSTLSSKKKVKNKGSIIKKTHSSFPQPPSFKKSSSVTGSVLSKAILPETKPSKISQSKWSKVSNKGSIASRTRYRSSSNLKLRGISINNKDLSSIINSSPKSSSKHTSRTKNLLKSPSKHTSRIINSSESPCQHTSRTNYPPKASRNVTARSTCTNSRSISRQSRSTTRYKKSRKNPSNAKIINEINHDIPRRVRGEPKGPCTRSFTSSNNRIQFQQLVHDKSKNIIKRKTTKANNSKNFNPSPNGLEEKDFFCQSTSYVPLAEKIRVTESASAPVTILIPKSSNLTFYSHKITSLLNHEMNVNCCEKLNESEPQDEPEYTWHLAKSLQKVAPLQLNISGKDYGVLDEYSIEIIRNLYRDFGILECSKYEDSDLNLLHGRISYLKNPCQTLLKTLVEKFCDMEIM